VDGNYGLTPKKLNDLFTIPFSLEPRNFQVAPQQKYRKVLKKYF